MGLRGCLYHDLWSLASGSEALREAHVGAKRAKHRAKRSPECADPNVVRGTPKVSEKWKVKSEKFAFDELQRIGKVFVIV